MSAEDRLRDALQSRAASVNPSDDGWNRIEQRMTQRPRNLARYLALALAVVAIPGALAVNAAIQDDGSKPLIVNPGSSTSTSTTAATPVGSVDYAIWPTAEMSVSYDSPAKVADQFARGFLGMKSPVIGVYRAGDARSGEIDIRAIANGIVTTLTVREDGVRGWRVFDARSANLELTTPKTFDTVASPITLTGRSVAFEGTVHITLIPYNGTLPCAFECGGPRHYLLGNGTFTGHGTELTPFEVPLRFDPQGEKTGVLILWTDSPMDGTLAEATVRLVRF